MGISWAFLRTNLEANFGYIGHMWHILGIYWAYFWHYWLSRLVVNNVVIASSSASGVSIFGIFLAGV